MKKSFTLLETIISISLFLILILFLYKTIDKTKHSNSLFTKNKEELEKSDFLHNIFLEDIGEATSILITYDKNKNSINYAINEKYISDVVEKLEMMGYEVAISNETILKIKW